MSDEPSRRDLLRASLGASGALVIAIALDGCGAGAGEGAHAVRPDGSFSPSAWLRLYPDDRIVFVLDRVEMGQGTMTGQAQLVAEELGVDPARLVVELAGASRAYDNPGLGLQATGGSTSTRESFVPLRQAAATAREMLRQAAARIWSAPLDECTVADGAVLHAASQRRLRYGQLLAAAARETVATPALRPASECTVIGRSVPRIDLPGKVDGTAVFGLDVKLPGLLTAVVLRPPALGATLLGFDAAQARAQPGVVDVFAIAEGVAVVAESHWRARRAAGLVEVRWSDGHAGLDTAALRRSYRERLASPGKVQRDEGDAPAALRADGARVLEAIYELPFLAHATMEPQNATARVTRDRCEVWAPTQAPGIAHAMVRRLTGLGDDQVVIHQTLLGGGFGRRLAQDYIVEAVQIARRLTRPVKVVWSREDDMRHDIYRPMATTWVRAAVSPDRRITGWFQRIATQSLTAAVAPDWVPAMAPGAVPISLAALLSRGARNAVVGGAVADESGAEGAADMAYAIPHLRVEHAIVNPGVPVGFWRSVGYSHNTFVTESFLDEVAHAIGRDPYELRRELLAGSPRQRAVLDLAAERAGWGRPLPPGVFRGIAQARAFRTTCAQVAEVSVQDGRIRVHRVVAAIDCGQVVNPDIVRAQIEGGIVFGLSAALRQAITLTRGEVDQSNFHDFELLRMHETPRIKVHLVPSAEPPTGVGEPGVPPIGPAVASAVFQATGRRLRRLPLERALAEDTP